MHVLSDNKNCLRIKHLPIANSVLLYESRHFATVIILALTKIVLESTTGRSLVLEHFSRQNVHAPTSY